MKCDDLIRVRRWRHERPGCAPSVLASCAREPASQPVGRPAGASCAPAAHRWQQQRRRAPHSRAPARQPEAARAPPPGSTN